MMRRKGKPMPTQPQEPVWWKVIVGALLILVEVKNHAFPSANLLKANNEGEQLGMYTAMALLIVPRMLAGVFGNQTNLAQDRVNREISDVSLQIFHTPD